MSSPTILSTIEPGRTSRKQRCWAHPTFGKAGKVNIRQSVTNSLRLLALGLALSGVAGAAAAGTPVLDAEAGPCALAITVSDPENRPVYAAKIRVTVRYGFMGLRKTSLEIHTDTEGKALLTGLPETPKGRLEFEVTSGRFSTIVSTYPSSRCGEDRLNVRFENRDLVPEGR